MKEFTAEELKSEMDRGANLVIIDVREPYEHEEFNIGGEVIPLAEIPFNSDRLKELGDVEIVLYCRSGNRSLMAQKILSMQFGINNTINLKGGIIAWKEMMNR